MKKNLKVYWSSGLKNGKKNFGDWLSPILCEAISGRKVEYAKPRHCDLVAVGSILHRLKNHLWTHRVDVWGSGLIEKKAPFQCIHNIHAVRGKLTATTLKNKEISVLGDPGLLSDILLPKRCTEKKYRVGIVPHYVDQHRPEVLEFIKKPGVTFIDIFSDTKDFLHQIDQCELILSSSLHGLIIADALQIPNSWIKLSERVRGDNFKFADYYSVFNLNTMQPHPFTLETNVSELDSIVETYQRVGLEDIKQQLLKAFPFK